MGSAPAGLLIESLLMTLNTVPTREVRPVVRAQRLDNVRGFAIAAFTAMYFEVFDAH